MSKWLDQLPDGTFKEEIYDRDGCRYFINEVCCNPECYWCCDYPDEEECSRCEYFEKEDDET